MRSPSLPMLTRQVMKKRRVVMRKRVETKRKLRRSQPFLLPDKLQLMLLLLHNLMKKES